MLERADNYLRSPETDWDRIYVRVRCSPLGEDYPRRTFLRTPVRAIRKVIALIDDQEKYKANVASLTNAQTACVILQTAHAYAGGKGRGPKAVPRDFLPFPKWKPTTTEESDGPDNATLHILSTLVRSMSIPMHVYVELTRPAEEAN